MQDKIVQSKILVKASLVAQMVKNLHAIQETRVWSLGQEDPLEKEMETHSSTLPGEFHGQRSLVSYNPWGHKESYMAERLTLSLSHSMGSCSLARSLNYISGTVSVFYFMIFKIDFAC